MAAHTNSTNNNMTMTYENVNELIRHALLMRTLDNRERHWNLFWEALKWALLILVGIGIHIAWSSWPAIS